MGARRAQVTIWAISLRIVCAAVGGSDRSEGSIPASFVAAARPIKAAGPMLSLKQKIRARLKVYALRVAISVSPNLRPRVRASDKRIVARHGAVVVQTQSFSSKRIQLLRQFALRRIARRDVK